MVLQTPLQRTDVVLTYLTAWAREILALLVPLATSRLPVPCVGPKTQKNKLAVEQFNRRV